ASVETLSLKALARRILDRDTQRDRGRDKVSRSPASEQRQPRQSVSRISSSPALDADEVAERAALIEFGADVPREWAEGFAKLTPERPALDVPSHRWRLFVDDVGRFLDGGFAKQAAGLGWTPFDLFGADPDKPFARIDKAGLLWLVGGAKLVALSQDTATIEMVNGIRQTFRRRPTEPDQALPWELVRNRADLESPTHRDAGTEE